MKALLEKTADLEDAMRRAVQDALDSGAYDLAEALLPRTREVASLGAKLQAVARQFSQRGEETGETGPQLDDARAFVQGDHLVLIGKSRNGGEYPHKVPRSSAGAILSALRKAASDGRAFTQRELMDLCNPRLPDYHIYTLTRALRGRGLIEKRSRGHYIVTDPQFLERSLDDLWAMFG